jgi:hypothetical protein
MRPARFPVARRRRRRLRVVTPAQASTMTTIDATTRKAFCTGLEFAELLRLHFPNFWMDHVATRMVKHNELVGLVGAFLSLAHTHLIALDIERAGGIPITPKNPREALHYPWYGSGKDMLASAGASWLRSPSLRVYGLGMEMVAPNNYYSSSLAAIEKHSLALLIWRLLSNTRWAVLSDTQVAELAMARVNNLDMARAIATARPLSSETPLGALCARLDADLPLGVSLGTIIAYACKRTGNGYADTTVAEMRQHYDAMIELNWHRNADYFAQQRADQQAAGKWSNAYSRLATRLWKNPGLLHELRDAIERTTVRVSRSADAASSTPYDPRPLINRFAAEEIDETLDDEAAVHAQIQALAAESPAAGTA